MRRIPERYVWRLFLIAMCLKALDGLTELACGVVLFWVNVPTIRRLVAIMTREELIEDPHDILANYLVRASQHLSEAQRRLAAAYLAVHGLIKLALVVAALSKRPGLYRPVMIVFGLLLAYECSQLASRPSAWLAAVCTFDAIVLALVWHEYRRLRAGLGGAN